MLCFIFAIRKILQILWKIFLTQSLYIYGKNVLVNKYKKQMCYKKNKSVFWRHERWWKFFLQKFVIFNVIPDCAEMGSITTCKEVRLQKPMKFILSELYFFWHFFKLLRHKESIGKSFSFPFSATCFDWNFKCLS